MRLCIFPILFIFLSPRLVRILRFSSFEIFGSVLGEDGFSSGVYVSRSEFALLAASSIKARSCFILSSIRMRAGVLKGWPMRRAPF